MWAGQLYKKLSFSSLSKKWNSIFPASLCSHAIRAYSHQSSHAFLDVRQCFYACRWSGMQSEQALALCVHVSKAVLRVIEFQFLSQSIGTVFCKFPLLTSTPSVLPLGPLCFFRRPVMHVRVSVKSSAVPLGAGTVCAKAKSSFTKLQLSNLRKKFETQFFSKLLRSHAHGAYYRESSDALLGV